MSAVAALVEDHETEIVGGDDAVPVGIPGGAVRMGQRKIGHLEGDGIEDAKPHERADGQQPRPVGVPDQVRDVAERLDAVQELSVPPQAHQPLTLQAAAVVAAGQPPTARSASAVAPR